MTTQARVFKFAGAINSSKVVVGNGALNSKSVVRECIMLDFVIEGCVRTYVIGYAKRIHFVQTLINCTA